MQSYLARMKNLQVCCLLLLLLLSGCGQSKEQMYQEGMKHVAAGNFRGAIVLFENALEKDGNFVDARFQLADAYLKTGKYTRAEKEFEKVLRQSPQNAEIPLKLAEIFNSTKRPEKAVDAVEKFLQDHPKTAEALNILGRGHAIQGHFSKAVEQFQAAIELDPDSVEAKINLARVYLKEDNLSAAKRLLEKTLIQHDKAVRVYFLLARLETSLGQRDKALKLYQQIAQIDPQNIKALYMAGLFQLDAANLNNAESIANDLVKKYPKRVEGRLLKGIVLYQQKKYADANVALLNAIKTQPSVLSYYFLGLSYYSQNNLELALNQFQKTLDLKPKFAQARALVAMTLLKQNRVDDAITESLKALKLAPKNGLIHNILGSAYLAKGKFDQAMVALDRATELDPQLVDAFTKKGLFHISKGDTGQAEIDLETALSLAPEVLNNRILLGSLYIRQQNYTLAIKVLNEGLSGKSQDALLYNYMAAAYFAQKKNDEALTALENAKKIEPRYFTPYFNIAAYQSSQGKQDLAIAEYQQIILREPANLKALRAMAALYELQGNNPEALNYFKQASQSGDVQGVLSYVKYLMRTSQPAAALTVVASALKININQPDLLKLKARILLAEQRPADAVTVLKQLDAAKPGSGIPSLIAVYLKTGETDKAVSLAKKVVQRSPDSAFGYRLLADIYARQGELTTAAQVLKDGGKTVTKGLPLEMGLASIYEQQGELEAAATLYQKIIREKPGFIPAQFSFGALQDRMGNKKTALKIYREVLDKAKNYTPVLNNLAYLYADNYHQPKKALKLALKAYRQNPSEPAVMDTLGFVLLKNDRVKEAVDLLEKAAKLLPDNPTPLYHLGLAYQQLGDKDKAKSVLEKALKGRAFPDAAKCRALLAKL